MVENEPRGVALRDDPPSATEDVAKLRLQLRRLTLSELEWVGLVSWDRHDHVVTRGPLLIDE